MDPEQLRVSADAAVHMGSERRPRFLTFFSLKNIDFRLLWAGSIFVNLALWLQFIARGSFRA